MEKRELKCLRCGTEMKFRENTNLVLKDSDFWNIEDRLKVEIYACPGCGKLEFFRANFKSPKETDSKESASVLDGVDTTGFYIPGVAEDIKCYHCGKMHPSDDPFCPLCGMPTKKAEKRTCAWCGEELDQRAKVCPRCGARQTEA